ncbi:hypothetical protein [Chryseobacterium salivictor]|uniref:Uncharacterized protein n=1 Tax=Chryseobacterium salivictor TaxID=2547600 RepID=A0A4P6ZGT3_9FLAO|nr:hypothetical protein [Chryseobacterium salivictor]QBO58792.1 hypothetical protein NBC122_01984 [Chryseobacterium salivictor]
MKIKFPIQLTIFASLNLFSQTFHVFENENVKIELLKPAISLHDVKNFIPIIYCVTNKSNETLLIGKNGFNANTSIIYEEDKTMVEYKGRTGFDGYPVQVEDNECEEYFVKLGKHQSIEMQLGLHKFATFNFDFNEEKKYWLEVRSLHNEWTSTFDGCAKFIENEKNNGQEF